MTSNKNLNFGSRPLHQTNLRNSSGGLVRAVISELAPKDPQDVEALQQIADSWHGAKYAKKILGFFEARNNLVTRYSNNPQIQDWLVKNNPEISNYYAVELPTEDPLHKKIIGIAMTRIKSIFNKNYLDLAFMQARPDLMYQGEGKKREFSGIGELLLAKAASLAKSSNAKCITIESQNPIFYEKTFENAGFAKAECQDPDDYRAITLNLSPKHYQKYLEYISKTYQSQF